MNYINQSSAVSGLNIPSVVSGISTTTPPAQAISGTVFGPASAVSSDIAEFDGTTGKLIKDGGISHADAANAVSLKHARQHAITATADHTSGATSGNMLKADAKGLPIDASNTDTEVANAVSLKHTQGTDTTLGILTSDVRVNDSAKGLVLKDTQATPHYWRVQVTTLGVLTTTDIGTSL